jgi:hypothetical protein
LDRWPTTRCASRPKEEFFYFFARKLLKSLDSEKEMKGNESEFPFISFHFLHELRALVALMDLGRVACQNSGRRPSLA